MPRVGTRMVTEDGTGAISLGFCSRQAGELALEPLDQHVQIEHGILKMHGPFGVHIARDVCVQHEPTEHLPEMMERAITLEPAV